MKKFRLVHILLLLNAVLLLANCIQEVDFQSPNADKNDLVVSGRITNLGGTQLLVLTRPGDYNKQAFEPVTGATVILSDDAGNSWQYLEYNRPDTAHFYYLPDFTGVPGRAYALGIDLPSGQHYTCAAQTMPQPVTLDSVRIHGEMVPLVRSDGGVVQEPHAVVYALTHRPVGSTNAYLRWDANAVFIFNEIIKIYDPFASQHQCFITSYFNGQNIQIADLQEVQEGLKLEQKVGKKIIDNAFDYRICFNTTQLTISKEAYDYWSKVKALLSATGTIFDAPPARIRGNVLLEGDPEHPSLGFFEVAGADIKRHFLNSGDLGPAYSFLNNYCDYDWGRWPPVNHLECDNCTILANSTLEVPDYW